MYTDNQFVLNKINLIIKLFVCFVLKYEKLKKVLNYKS